MEAVTQSVSNEQPTEVDESILNSLIDMVPIEIHVPGYQFCGPGTKLAERLERGEVGINPLDAACREHDIAYATKNCERTEADRALAERAFSRVLDRNVSFDERTAAILTACCMVSKITFENLFSRIKNLVSHNREIKKKKKKQDIKKKEIKKPQEKKVVNNTIPSSSKRKKKNEQNA